MGKDDAVREVEVKFGHMEIVAFGEGHEDERVRVMLKRYLETRSKVSVWANRAIVLEEKLRVATELLKEKSK